jgi:hypothetical protein
MIKSNELRVGNFFTDKTKCNYLVEIETVSRYGTTKIRVTEGDSGYVYDSDLTHLSPTPLTPEILEKCGFVKSLTTAVHGMITEDGKNRFTVFEDGRFKFHTEDLSVKIKYLHQLQNLVFALTGEELTFKP